MKIKIHIHVIGQERGGYYLTQIAIQGNQHS